ncbi:MAG: radical SAM protein [Candidatus Diapherotrites archaeon]|nr:radical SAM protein [Candidatus Diapherotrites archaeon]
MEVTLISTDFSVISFGIRVFSAILKQNGIACNCIFLPPPKRIAFSSSLYPKECLEQVCKIASNSGVVGVSCVSLSSKHAIEVLNAIKEKTNAFTMWGGIHATTNPEECINFADAVCIGEGEGAFLELVKALEKRKPVTKIKNLWVKNGKSVFKNEVRELIHDLDSLPFPSFDSERNFVLEGKELVPFEERHLGGKYFVSGSRGCPHSCTYCCSGLLNKLYLNKGKSVRFRSIESIINELELAVKKFPSICEIIFTDDVFIVRPKEELKKFAFLFKKKVRLKFQYYVSPLTLSEEKLKILLSAGSSRVVMGIQSGSERVNFEIYKRFTSKQKILQSAEIMSRHASQMYFLPVFDFILLNPYEREDDIIESIKTISELKLPFVIDSYILAFFPGTELYVNALSDGTINNNSIFALDYLAFDGLVSLNRPNKYLNSLVFLMSGKATEKKIGALPRNWLKFLTSKKTVAFNEKFPFFYIIVLFLIVQKRTLLKKLLELMHPSLRAAIKKVFHKS